MIDTGTDLPIQRDLFYPPHLEHLFKLSDEELLKFTLAYDIDSCPEFRDHLRIVPALHEQHFARTMLAAFDSLPPVQIEDSTGLDHFRSELAQGQI